MSTEQPYSHPLDDESVGAVTPPAEKSAQPRISILHLMAWTATSAAMMAVLRLPSEAAEQLSAFETGYRVAFAMYSGVVTGGVLMWIARSWREVPFPTQPGEWLLLMQGEIVLASLVMLFVGNNAQGPAEFLLVFLYFAALLAIGLVPVIRYREPDAWQIFLRVFAGFLAMPICTFFLMLLTNFAAIGPMGFLTLAVMFFASVAFLIAVGVDFRRRRKRGWVHWTGVWSLFLITAFHVLIFIVGQIVSAARF